LQPQQYDTDVSNKINPTELGYNNNIWQESIRSAGIQSNAHTFLNNLELDNENTLVLNVQKMSDSTLYMQFLRFGTRRK
jgi:hypothetical protein